MIERKPKNRREKPTTISAHNPVKNTDLGAGLSTSAHFAPGWNLEPEESETTSDSMSDNGNSDSDAWYKH